MKYILNLVGFVIVTICSFLLGFLMAYIIRDLSILYKLTVISSLTFAQIYCFCFIIGMLRANIKSEDTNDKDSFGDKLWIWFGEAIFKSLVYLIAWGIMYIIHGIIV
jgi:hypothetical protein